MSAIFEVHAVFPHLQKTESDCVHAAVATLCGVSYQDISKSTHSVRRGMSIEQAKRTAERVGCRLSVLRTIPDLEGFTGLLWLMTREDSARHCVSCFQGVVVEPETGILWDRDTYLKRSKYKVEKVLVRIQ